MSVHPRLRSDPLQLTTIPAIEVEENVVSWAAAGSNVTTYLTSVDPVHLGIGSVLCPLNDLVPLATVFTARIIVFDIQIPIIAGAAVRIFSGTLHRSLICEAD
jgi:elongation factor 1 alpha-like protein